MGPSDAKDVARDVARDLSSVAGELATLKGDADNWLSDPECAVLRHRLEGRTPRGPRALQQALFPYAEAL